MGAFFGKKHPLGALLGAFLGAFFIKARCAGKRVDTSASAGSAWHALSIGNLTLQLDFPFLAP